MSASAWALELSDSLRGNGQLHKSLVAEHRNHMQDDQYNDHAMNERSYELEG